MPSIMERPLFSIITITFNAQQTLQPTLDSVDCQSCRDYEHLIVDGVSTDATLAILSKARNKARSVHSSPDEGIYDAMNKGIGLSRGRYLIFLNAGDRFHSSDTLATIKRAIEDNDNPGIVYGQTILVDNDGNFLAPRHLAAPDDLSYKDFARGMLVCHQAFVANRSLAPLYNLRWKFSSDYEWCIICLMHSRKNVNTREVLIDYLAEGATTANRRKSLIERFRIMCHYYGFIPTALRHLGFVRRFFKHKKELKNASV